MRRRRIRPERIPPANHWPLNHIPKTECCGCGTGDVRGSVRPPSANATADGNPPCLGTLLQTPVMMDAAWIGPRGAAGDIMQIVQPTSHHLTHLSPIRLTTPSWHCIIPEASSKKNKQKLITHEFPPPAYGRVAPWGHRRRCGMHRGSSSVTTQPWQHRRGGVRPT